MSLFASLEPGDPRYFYHYTSADGLMAILKNQTLRLSPLSRMNDRRETNSWMPSVSAEDPDDRFDDFQDIVKAASLEMRERIRVLCLSMDRLQGSELGYFSRGYGRPRMWAQYGQGHEGACLIFEADKLIERFEARFAVSDERAHRHIDYDNGPVGDEYGILTLSGKALRLEGTNATARKFLNTHLPTMVFRKSLDWSAEDEYRFLVQTDEEFPTFDIQGALAGVMVGEGFGEHLVSTVTDLAPSAPTSRMRWMNGSPIPVPMLS